MLATLSTRAEETVGTMSPVRVMSFNIRNSGARDGANDWRHRKETFVAAVRDFAPDLLGTQEVLADQFDDLKAAFPEFATVGVARDDGARAGEWSANLYRTARFVRIDGGDFWLSETPEKVGSKSWDAACVRICTWVRLRDVASGAPVLFANTHFDHQSAKARVESAKLLRERLPRLADGAPVILAGDFNCTEDDEPYRTLVAGMADSFREVYPERKPEEASFHGFTGKLTGSRIDWILHTPQLKATAAEIVRPTEPRMPSDHFAVTAIIEPTR